KRAEVGWCAMKADRGPSTTATSGCGSTSRPRSIALCLRTQNRALGKKTSSASATLSVLTQWAGPGFGIWTISPSRSSMLWSSNHPSSHILWYSAFVQRRGCGGRMKGGAVRVVIPHLLNGRAHHTIRQGLVVVRPRPNPHGRFLARPAQVQPARAFVFYLANAALSG